MWSNHQPSGLGAVRILGCFWWRGAFRVARNDWQERWFEEKRQRRFLAGRPQGWKTRQKNSDNESSALVDVTHFGVWSAQRYLFILNYISSCARYGEEAPE